MLLPRTSNEIPFGTIYMMAFTLQGRDRSAVKLREGVVNDVELGLPFKRVENLVWIKGNSLYREALEDWERQKKLLGAKLDRREKRSEELTNEVYNLVGFYSVFQGVILTAVTQLTQSTQSTQAPSGCPPCSPRPLCGKVWFPVVLSGLAAIAAIVGIVLKFSHLHSIDKLIHAERLEQREAEKRESKLQEKGENFLFRSLGDARPRPLKSYWLPKAVGVIGAVVVFTVIFILSYFVILCDKMVI